MTSERITIIIRDGHNHDSLVKSAISDGFTELVDHYYDIASECDVLVFAKP